MLTDSRSYMPERTVENFTCTLPWRTGDRVALLADGDQFFPRMLNAIEQASVSVEMEMYLFESGVTADRFIGSLEAAIDRGVRVRLLLDYFGSYRLNQRDVLRLRDIGVELRFFNRIRRHKLLHNLSRDHRKILIIDHKLAFVGGAGITDEFSPRVSGHQAWRELMVEMEGPIIKDWQILFERVWANHDNTDALRYRLLHYKPSTHTPHLMNREIPQARVNASRGLGNKPIMGALLSEIRKADSHIWISTAYFYPSGKLLKALRKAALRGIDVRLLLPGPYTDHPGVRHAGRSLYTSLLKDNVRIYEYQPRVLHMKLALVDNWCSIGSCNFDRWNLRWNLEANLEIIDAEFSRNIEAMLVNDFAQSLEYTLDRWKQRSLGEKIREFFWKYVGLFVNRMTDL